MIGVVVTAPCTDILLSHQVKDMGIVGVGLRVRDLDLLTIGEVGGLGTVDPLCSFGYPLDRVDSIPIGRARKTSYLNRGSRQSGARAIVGDQSEGALSKEDESEEEGRETPEERLLWSCQRTTQNFPNSVSCPQNSTYGLMRGDRTSFDGQP